MNGKAKGMLAAWLCAVFLQGCGGGGGGGGEPAPTPASITTQPATQAAPDGAEVQLSVSAVHATGYRWQRSDDGGATWTDISGAGASTLSLTANYAARNADYRVIVSGSGGDVTSAVVGLTVSPVAPRFDAQPTAQTVSVGQSAVFSVSLSGTLSTVRWQTSTDGSTWFDVTGATAATLQIDQPDTRRNGALFRAVATNPAAEVDSQVATLTVLASSLSPTFVTQPVSVTVPAGGTARFDARTQAEATGETLQWQSSADGGATWTDVPGLQFARLTLPVTSADNGKQFRRLAGNAHDQAISAVATLTVATPARQLTLLAGRIGGSGDADGLGADARLSDPTWPSVDAHGNVYVGTFAVLRKIDPSGRVSMFAGDALHTLGGTFTDAATGSGGAVNLGLVTGTAATPDGTVYSADAIYNTIRKTLPDGSTGVFAGTPDPLGGSADGTGAAARFLHPHGLALDAAGNVYVADTDNHTIRRITPGGVVTTLAGQAGVAGSGGSTVADALFRSPLAVAVGAAGRVYVADSSNYTVRVVDPGGAVSLLAGSVGVGGNADGLGSAASFGQILGLAVDAAGKLYVSDTASVRQVGADGRVQTLVSNFTTPNAFVGGAGVAVDPTGGLVVSDNTRVQRLALDGTLSPLAGARGQFTAVDGTGGAATFGPAGGMTTDSAGNVYVVDAFNGTLRKVTPAGVVTTLHIGLPPGYSRSDVAIDPAGNLIVAGECAVRRVAPNGVVSIVAGQPGTCGAVDGNGSSARFSTLDGVAVDPAGNMVVTDAGGLHKITPAGDASLFIANTGVNVDGPRGTAKISGEGALAFDQAGNLLVGQPGAVRKVAPDGTVSTLAGTPFLTGSIDGAAGQGRLGYVSGIVVDTAGNVYISDLQYSTIRRIAPDGSITTLLGTAETEGVMLGANPLINEPTSLTLADAHHLALMSENALLLYTLP